MQSSTGHAQTPGGGSSVNILSSFPSRASPKPAIARAGFRDKLASVGGTAVLPTNLPALPCQLERARRQDERMAGGGVAKNSFGSVLGSLGSPGRK